MTYKGTPCTLIKQCGQRIVLQIDNKLIITTWENARREDRPKNKRVWRPEL